LILIPFYFFAAVGVFLALSLACRGLRLALTAHTAAVSSVLLGLALVLVPLLTGAAHLADYSLRRLVPVLLGSFALAALDLFAEKHRRLPLDHELGEL
jgi:uncharacterized membrane protein